MLVLITYDVSTSDSAGKKRLHKVAKACLNCGQRVQNSVFECYLDAAAYEILKNNLIKLIDQKKDSLRMYNLGNNYRNRIEHFGVHDTYDPEDFLMV